MHLQELKVKNGKKKQILKEEDLDSQEKWLQQKLQEHKALLQEMVLWKGKEKAAMQEHMKDRFPHKFSQRRPYKYLGKALSTKSGFEGGTEGNQINEIMMVVTSKRNHLLPLVLCTQCNSPIIAEYMPG